MSERGVGVLDISSVSVSFGATQVLRDVSLQLHKGESVAVMGRTGSGKSTLLSCVTGLLRPSSGSVSPGGRRIDSLKPQALAAYRRSTLGVVFQMGELLPALTPVENVALPAMLSGSPWSEVEPRAIELLESLRVPIAEVSSGVLSGGERQRAALARALINGPRLLVADEPTGALDAETRDEVVDLIFRQPSVTGCGLLLVTHDPKVAARADRVFKLDAGVLTQTVLVDAS